MATSYSRNFQASMMGNNGLGAITEPSTEDPKDPKNKKKNQPVDTDIEPTYGKGEKGPLKQQADFRDIVTGLVANGVIDLTSDDARSDFSGLKNIVGPDKARQLMNSIIIHNKTNAKKPMNERIISFYDQSVNDPELDVWMKNAKGFGEGVISGLYSSPYKSNIIASGRDLPAENIDEATKSERLRKIMAITANQK